mmetsp:Transcript_15045/g.21439  ORF Transcript_15045/g.21439 Transcript_15045/m.21439 type:complete len:98 (-) Transcript_15045:17-310(-)
MIFLKRRRRKKHRSAQRFAHFLFVVSACIHHTKLAATITRALSSVISKEKEILIESNNLYVLVLIHPKLSCKIFLMYEVKEPSYAKGVALLRRLENY